MADEAQLVLLREKGVRVWNEWRELNPQIWPDLRMANLVRAELKGANLYRANLLRSVLAEADLRRADLTGADLRQADLRATDFSNADLRGANFYGAALYQADFSRATVGFTEFEDIDLREIKGLGTVKHVGPSEVSVRTIYRSQGKIPFEFLRGAGVPDNFIEYMHSLTGAAFEYYSCFISYSSMDQQFAERLYADLQARGVRCWFAPQHGQSGQKLHRQIDQAIRVHEKLLLILSPNSMSSEWVRTEIRKAAKRQAQEKKDVLFPVSLVPFDQLREWECWDGDLGKDLASEIREYLIPDFSRWKEHDLYSKSFGKLLRDLRSGRMKAAAS
ncbi:MAG TPA: toll/interleukin-1 receptor domain-containing protein [Candidatus Angelobacter sp.]|nr:toll/interleukin-1 receptor domain-containing protein [Candidatus Angelobacter sp.]